MNYLERPSHTRLHNQRSNTKSGTDHYIDNNISTQRHNSYTPSSAPVNNLTGLPINAGEFTHNNMVPFFGGTIKQNIDSHANASRLESFTGVQQHRIKKEEIKPLFQPTKDNSYVHGTPHQIESTINRYIPSQMRTCETPIKKIMVGPGINKGYGWKPSGGLNHDNVREAVLPKTVDQLRTITNPKVTYNGIVIAGKNPNDKRTCQAQIEKRAPDTYYKNDPRRYNTTVGATTKQTGRAKSILKHTSRTVSKPIIGPAGPAANKRAVQRPDVQQSQKIQYKQDSIRNAGGATTKVTDYGKSGHLAVPNERTITGTRTHTSNLTNIVKALIAPLQDLLKPTRKETTSNIENFGNIDGLYQKQTVYDPTDTTRTTIKETNIHNNVTGPMGLQAPPKLTIYDSNDIMRTTIKETNIHNEHSGNLYGPTRLTLYDPNDIAKTTIKETNIFNNRDGNVTTVSKRQPIYDPNDTTKTTIKETTIHNSRDGNLSMITKCQPAYDPNDITRTTIKETNIHNSRDGNLTSVMKRQQAYDPTDTTRTTIKETNIHNERDGNLSMINKCQPVYDPNDTTRTTIKETNIHNERDGNLTSVMKRQQAYDPMDITRTTIKETNIHNERDGNLGMSAHQLPVYDPNNITRPTIKETNIHNNRDGNLSTVSKRQPATDPNDITRTTIKETNIHNTQEGHLSGPKRQSAYDPNDITRTTIKETNIHNTQEGHLSGPERQPAYDPNDIAKTTIKETNIHDVRTGNLHGNEKTHVYDATDIARVTGRNTLVAEDHNLNIQGMKKPRVVDPDLVAKTTIRETTEGNNYEGQVEATQQGDGYLTANPTAKITNRETTDDFEYSGVADADARGGGGDGYLTANPTVKNNNRMTTDDYEYSGTAKGHSQPISYENIYNATLNDLRECVLEEREPTTSNAKVVTGADGVQMEIKKMENDIINNREISKTAVINHIPVATSMGELNNHVTLDNDKLADRNNPAMLNAFKTNPYTHSLTSH